MSEEARPAAECELPRMGVHDGSPCLSHDGKTLVWFHREAEQAYLCVLTFPWHGAPQKVEVRNALRVRNYTDPIQLSGDGCQALVTGQHVEIVDGKPMVRGRLPELVSYFGAAVSFDGSAVVTSIEGGRRVRLFSCEEGRYVKGAALTPTNSRQPVRNWLISGDGKVVMYEQGDTLWQARSGGTTWQMGPIPPERPIGMTPRSLSADGRMLLARGITLARGRKAASIYLWSRDGSGKWQEPKLVLDNQRHAVYNCRMSADARTVLWVHYTRDNNSRITRTELKFIRQQGDGWSEPTTVLKQEGHIQFGDISLADNDVLAYTLTTKVPSSYTVFLRPDLKPGTQAININERMRGSP